VRFDNGNLVNVNKNELKGMEQQKKGNLLEQGAILQRDGETYAVTPRLPCGLITDFNILRKMADVAEKFGAAAIKVTSAQRLAIIGVKEEDLDQIWRELGMTPGIAFGLCIRSIKACPGAQFCKLGQQDSLALGLHIEERFAHLTTPSKLKISVSGCPMDCAEAHVRDIGLIGTKKGYNLEVGGAVGPNPRIGQCIAKELDDEAAEGAIARIIEAYQKMKKPQRLGKVIETMGLDAFKQLIGV
jgi:NAD(P)H-nitrite reductase large subunit